MAKREHFSDLLQRGLRRPSRQGAVARPTDVVCAGFGHPNDAHPFERSDRRACAVYIWEIDMGHRPEQACCQQPIAAPHREVPHHRH